MRRLEELKPKPLWASLSLSKPRVLRLMERGREKEKGKSEAGEKGKVKQEKEKRRKEIIKRKEKACGEKASSCLIKNYRL